MVIFRTEASKTRMESTVSDEWCRVQDCDPALRTGRDRISLVRTDALLSALSIHLVRFRVIPLAYVCDQM
jgi:hypothetical protein